MAAGGIRGRVARGLSVILLAGTFCTALAAACLPLDSGTMAALSLRLEDHLRTQAPLPPARVALGPRGRDIRLAGEIGEGTAERLRALLAAHPAVARIHLTSGGGLVDEALAVGDLIAGRGLATYVPDYCVSACTLAFVRGSARYLVVEGRLGFHAPYDPGLFGGVVQADAAPERAAYVAAGVELAFADEALRVASDDLWIPEAARLVRARVVTDIVDTDRFPDSTLDDDPSPAGARAAVLRALPLLEALAGPEDGLDPVAASYLDGYRAGLPEGEALDRLRARARTEIARVLRGADDATWVEIGHTLLRAMRRAPPAACRVIGGAGDLLAAHETLQELQEGSNGARNDNAARVVLARAARDRAAGGGRAEPGASGVGAPAGEPGAPRDCAGLIAAYTRALARPGAGAALRVLAGQRVRPALEASASPADASR